MRVDESYRNFVGRMGSFEDSLDGSIDQEDFNKLLSSHASRTVDDVLKHHGILGMRWGVRRPIGPDGLIKSKSSPSQEHLTSRELKAQSVSSLTNAQLKSLTQRLQLEKQLNDLTPRMITRGHNEVKTILGYGATITTAYALYKSPVGQAIKNAIAKAVKS